MICMIVRRFFRKVVQQLGSHLGATWEGTKIAKFGLCLFHSCAVLKQLALTNISRPRQPRIRTYLLHTHSRIVSKCQKRTFSQARAFVTGLWTSSASDDNAGVLSASPDAGVSVLAVSSRSGPSLELKATKKSCDAIFFALSSYLPGTLAYPSWSLIG